MSGGGKGGSQTSATEIPPWAEAAMQRNIQRAENLARVGNQVYYGPQVAAFNPTQIAAMDTANQAAAAFGLGAPTGSVAESLPVATDFGNGLTGYETGTLADQAFQEWASRNPQAAGLYNQEFAQRGTGQSGGGFEGLIGAMPTGDSAMVNPQGYGGYGTYYPSGGKGGVTGYGGGSLPAEAFNTEMK